MPAHQISPINVRAASPAEYTAINQHNNRMRQERLPDDPPVPLQETIADLQNRPSSLDMYFWAAWNPSQTEIIGQVFLMMYRVEENQHLAHFNLTVLPEYRRQGIGREILRCIANLAQKENRSVLMTMITGDSPIVAGLMARLGAKGLEDHTNQLQLSDLDRNLLASWLVNGQKHSTAFEIDYWDGPYPEDKLQAMVEMFELGNQMPLGDLQIENMHTSPTQLRQMEENLFSRGCERWTFYLIERATGKFVGYTETSWNPNHPELLQQDMTGVFPEYQNKGLGRWLKAAMLDKVLKERPQVKYIRSLNADINAAMLKINNELGFKPYTVETLWQVETQKVLEYLQASL